MGPTPEQIGGFVAGIIAGLPASIVAALSLRKGKKRLETVEAEIRNGRTGKPVDPADTMRVAVDEIRELSRTTARHVATMAEEQQGIRGELRDLRDEVDELKAGTVLHAARAVAALRREQTPGQVASTTFLEQRERARAAGEPEER